MSRPALDEALAALEGLRKVTTCDCREAGIGYDGCRHTSLPELVLNPSLYTLWCFYRDAVERTGSDGSAEAQAARWRLDDAMALLQAEGPVRPQ